MDEMQNSIDQEPVKEPDKLEGIGGWLFLVALLLITAPIGILLTIGKFLPSYSPDIWKLVTTVGSQIYHPLLAPLLIFEMAFNVGLMVFSIVLLVLFFMKKKSFPKLFIIFLVVQLMGVSIDYVGLRIIPVLAGQSGQGLRNIISAVIKCAVWIPYMRVSARVEKTFVK